MSISLDQLVSGFAVSRTHSPLRENPAIGLYGQSGSGKSLDFNIAIQDAMVVKTGPTVTRPYYSWQREQDRPAFDRGVHDFKVANASQSTHKLYEAYADQCGLSAVEKTTGWRALLPEVDIPGGTSYWWWVEELRKQLVAARQQNVTIYDQQGVPIRGVIFDEFNTIMHLVYGEMVASGQFVPKKITGTIFDQMPAMNYFDDWLTGFVFEFRQYGILLGLVCQEAPLAYDEDKQSKFYGQIKYKTGPLTPFGRLRSKLTQIVDFMWRITLESGSAMAPTLALPGVTLPGVTTPAGPALPSVVALPGVAPAPVNGLLPANANGATTTISGSPAASASVVGGGSTWPLPAKPLKGWSTRRYWTEARPDVEAKSRDVVIPYQVGLGLREQLARAGVSI